MPSRRYGTPVSAAVSGRFARSDRKQNHSSNPATSAVGTSQRTGAAGTAIVVVAEVNAAAGIGPSATTESAAAPASRESDALVATATHSRRSRSGIADSSLTGELRVFESPESPSVGVAQPDSRSREVRDHVVGVVAGGDRHDAAVDVERERDFGG